MSLVMLFVGICTFIFVFLFLFNELGKDKFKEMKNNKKDKENEVAIVEEKPSNPIVMTDKVEEMINRAQKKKDN